MTKCPTCFDVTLGYNTGEAGQRGTLDCADCDTATERAAFNNSMSDVCLTRKDNDWHAYQLGRDDAEAVAAEQVKELRAMLLKIWGHAIELGETDYFDDPQFGKADWAADCAAAAKLLRKMTKD